MNTPTTTPPDSPTISSPLHFYETLTLTSASSSSSVSQPSLYPMFEGRIKRERDDSCEKKREVKKIKSEEIQNIAGEVKKTEEKYKSLTSFNCLLSNPTANLASLSLYSLEELLKLHKLARKYGAKTIELEIKNQCLDLMFSDKEIAAKLTTFWRCAEAFKDDFTEQEVGKFFARLLEFPDLPLLFSLSYLKESRELFEFLDQIKARNVCDTVTLNINSEIRELEQYFEKVLGWFPKLTSLTLSTDDEKAIAMDNISLDADYFFNASEELFYSLQKVKNLRQLEIHMSEKFSCLVMDMRTLVELLGLLDSLEEVVLKDFQIARLYENEPDFMLFLIEKDDFTENIINELSQKCPRLVSISLVDESFGKIKVTIQGNAE